MMSASLLSDMESFKAANPNGTIEDFIRWYSPRDWIEDDEAEDNDSKFGRKIKIKLSIVFNLFVGSGSAEKDGAASKKGHLSARMMIPGNTWQMVWQTAKPVPARRQRRLFDDTKEAEKVLHFFESRTIGQIVQLTLAALYHTATLTIKVLFLFIHIHS